VDDLLERLETLAELGVTHTRGIVPHASDLEPLRLLGREVIPAADRL
jgi:hypothetical protein